MTPGNTRPEMSAKNMRKGNDEIGVLSDAVKEMSKGLIERERHQRECFPAPLFPIPKNLI